MAAFDGSVQLGMVVTMLAGVVSVIELVLSKVLQQIGWPFFTLMGTSALLTSLVFGGISLAMKAASPQRSQLKWVFLRAFFGVFSLVLGVTAVQAGASPGDVATLTSINIVFAAMLGQLFLKEHLRVVHIVAVLFSVSGAVLIARPKFLFGTVHSSTSWVGNVLALLSGLMQASVYICARKSKDVSANWLSCATATTAVPVFFLMPLTPLASAETLQLVLAEPWSAAGLVAMLLVTTLLAISLSTIGSVLCPAAVSATVYTASSMSCGYVLQTLLFNLIPTPLTIGGAALMLAAVALMAAARVQRSEAPAVGAAPVQADDDNESLASFVAAEFASVEPHAQTAHMTMVRQRRPDVAPKPQPQPQAFGAVIATLSA